MLQKTDLGLIIPTGDYLFRGVSRTFYEAHNGLIVPKLIGPFIHSPHWDKSESIYGGDASTWDA